MKIKIHVTIENENQMENENQVMTEYIASLERGELSAETLGLTLKESKIINSEIQKKMIDCQVKDYVSRHRFCSCCGSILSIKGSNSLIYRTLFGKIDLKSPRLFTCKCQSQVQSSFSPLSPVLKDHILLN